MERHERDAGLIGRITLLTDFGTADGYVAAMRGVIASRAPAAIVDDVSHEIPPGDVRAGAFALAKYWREYPPGTVHVAVIDPGVGTARRAIVVSADGRHGVGPDNGVLSPVVAVASAIHEIRAADLIRQARSATFDGRDVFAPAAAYLAAGGRLAQVGPAIADPARLPAYGPGRTDAGVSGRVVHVDRFGSLITDIPALWIDREARVEVAGRDVGLIRRTYGDVDPGDFVALIGSGDCLEISVRDGSAAARSGAGRDAEVLVRWTT